MFCLSLFNDGIRGENWWLKCSSSYLKKKKKKERKEKRKRNIEQEECERGKDGVGERKGEVVVLGGWGWRREGGVLCTLGVFFKAAQT